MHKNFSEARTKATRGALINPENVRSAQLNGNKSVRGQRMKLIQCMNDEMQNGMNARNVCGPHSGG